AFLLDLSRQDEETESGRFSFVHQERGSMKCAEARYVRYDRLVLFPQERSRRLCNPVVGLVRREAERKVAVIQFLGMKRCQQRPGIQSTAQSKRTRTVEAAADPSDTFVQTVAQGMHRLLERPGFARDRLKRHPD